MVQRARFRFGDWSVNFDLLMYFQREVTSFIAPEEPHHPIRPDAPDALRRFPKRKYMWREMQ